MQGIINVKSPKLVYNYNSFSQFLVLGILWTLVFNNASVKSLSQLCEGTQSTLDSNWHFGNSSNNPQLR